MAEFVLQNDNEEIDDEELLAPEALFDENALDNLESDDVDLPLQNKDTTITAVLEDISFKVATLEGIRRKTKHTNLINRGVALEALETGLMREPLPNRHYTLEDSEMLAKETVKRLESDVSIASDALGKEVQDVQFKLRNVSSGLAKLNDFYLNKELSIEGVSLEALDDKGSLTLEDIGQCNLSLPDTNDFSRRMENLLANDVDYGCYLADYLKGEDSAIKKISDFLDNKYNNSILDALNDERGFLDLLLKDSKLQKDMEDAIVTIRNDLLVTNGEKRYFSTDRDLLNQELALFLECKKEGNVKDTLKEFSKLHKVFESALVDDHRLIDLHKEINKDEEGNLKTLIRLRLTTIQVYLDALLELESEVIDYVTVMDKVGHIVKSYTGALNEASSESIVIPGQYVGSYDESVTEVLGNGETILNEVEDSLEGYYNLLNLIEERKGIDRVVAMEAYELDPNIMGPSHRYSNDKPINFSDDVVKSTIKDKIKNAIRKFYDWLRKAISKIVSFINKASKNALAWVLGNLKQRMDGEDAVLAETTELAIEYINSKETLAEFRELKEGLTGTLKDAKIQLTAGEETVNQDETGLTKKILTGGNKYHKTLMTMSLLSNFSGGPLTYKGMSDLFMQLADDLISASNGVNNTLEEVSSRLNYFNKDRESNERNIVNVFERTHDLIWFIEDAGSRPAEYETVIKNTKKLTKKLEDFSKTAKVINRFVNDVDSEDKFRAALKLRFDIARLLLTLSSIQASSLQPPVFLRKLNEQIKLFHLQAHNKYKNDMV